MNAEMRPQPASDYSLLINGKLVDGASTFDVINPATEQVVAACPRADSAPVNQAGRGCQGGLSRLGREADRGAPAAAGEARGFACLAQRRDRPRPDYEQGRCSVIQSRRAGGSIAMIRAFAAMDLPVKVLKETDSAKIVMQRTPLGVVAAITPWNFPLILLMMKVAPALLAGNTIVVKPAPTTPLSTLRFGELCAEIFPAGVVNVITDQNDLGGALTAHPDIAKVAFTGSTATGRKVMASVAGTLKRLTLELGGNDAAIVLDDVDPKAIAPKIFGGAMVNTGQVCLAIKRVYAHDSIYDALCTELAKLADAAVVGDGLQEGTQYGPLQNKVQYDKVQGCIEDARVRGKIIAGGTPHKGKGYFIRPTIVRDIPDDARLVREGVRPTAGRRPASGRRPLLPGGVVDLIDRFILIVLKLVAQRL